MLKKISYIDSSFIFQTPNWDSFNSNFELNFDYVEILLILCFLKIEMNSGYYIICDWFFDENISPYLDDKQIKYMWSYFRINSKRIKFTEEPLLIAMSANYL